MQTTQATESKATILIVDDEPDVREVLEEYFSSHGYTALCADGAASARTLAAERAIDLALVDIHLPGEDGLSLARHLRERYAALAIIMLTSAATVIDRVVGLEVGADDYVPKPFEPRELVARIQAVIRRGTHAPDAAARMATFSGWRFDRMARQLLTADGVAVALSAAEYRLLCAFVDHAGRVLCRDRLLDLTRAPGTEVNDRSIDLAVSRLRTKLGDSSKEPRLIRTVRGEGYLFDTEVPR